MCTLRQGGPVHEHAVENLRLLDEIPFIPKRVQAHETEACPPQPTRLSSATHLAATAANRVLDRSRYMQEVIKQGLEDWRAKRAKYDWATFQDRSDSQLPDQIDQMDPLVPPPSPLPSPSPRVRIAVEESATGINTVRSRLPAGAPHLFASHSLPRTPLTSLFRASSICGAHALDR